MPNSTDSFVFAGTPWSSLGSSGAMPWTQYGNTHYGPAVGGPSTKGSIIDSASSGAADATSFNLSNSASMKNLSDMINQINLSATKASQDARIPGGPALEGQSSANIKADLAGQVDPDTLSLLQQQAAERGAAGGAGSDSPNTSAAYLRALGLTSYGRKQAGQTELTGALARNPAAPTFDPTTQLLTPAQASQINLGYKTEADRAAEEQQRLAIEQARLYGGGGGGGGGGHYGTGGYGYGGPGGNSPYQYDFGTPGEVVGGYTGPTSSGQTVGSSTPFNWQQSLGNYTPAGDTSGYYYAGPQGGDTYDYGG